MGENDVLFVKLRDPVDLRRSILETTKEVIESLQRYEKYRDIREEKKQMIAELRQDIKEINKLINKLRSLFPKTKMRMETKGEKKVISEKVVKKVPRKIKKPEVFEKTTKLTEIDKLEAELKEIESKLSGIK